MEVRLPWRKKVTSLMKKIRSSAFMIPAACIFDVTFVIVHFSMCGCDLSFPHIILIICKCKFASINTLFL
jgi:hypothetical protein